ncbi:unnamed protein product [Rhizophagus irregularis]|uniref:Uncharacterized protein n=1 Tax=Rhizophagus irregularis TaxID=588596 RepID=A0A915ZVA4_9GLOM|nr:unnamed protein product [Rhizophagus irregularis]CAB4491954.1 unnamed protein product [Rhizophagus irregularis]CAB5179476.1 unnamed protein product [Rhizophagus irregularis]CAB5387592.1 unnamed protein product [Rhizophagus irregularis]CAB5392382.1 unnamed protein product [Rhizophagus irregularis]
MEALTTIYPNNMSENEDSIANEDSITQTIINNTYRTKEHWTEVLHGNQNIWLYLHCNVKQYSSNTSRTHLKNHTLSCLNNNMTKSNSIKPVTKEEVRLLIWLLALGCLLMFLIVRYFIEWLANFIVYQIHTKFLIQQQYHVNFQKIFTKQDLDL